jgi:hypothetical protein
VLEDVAAAACHLGGAGGWDVTGAVLVRRDTIARGCSIAASIGERRWTWCLLSVLSRHKVISQL